MKERTVRYETLDGEAIETVQLVPETPEERQRLHEAAESTEDYPEHLGDIEDWLLD